MPVSGIVAALATVATKSMGPAVLSGLAAWLSAASLVSSASAASALVASSWESASRGCEGGSQGCLDGLHLALELGELNVSLLELFEEALV